MLIAATVAGLILAQAPMQPRVMWKAHLRSASFGGGAVAGTRGAEGREMNLTSGLQAITHTNVHGKPMWLGGADPRREGVVMGD